MLDITTSMIATLGDLRTIEKFLIHEVQLLDERRFEEWRDLFAEDGVYLGAARARSERARRDARRCSMTTSG